MLITRLNASQLKFKWHILVKFVQEVNVVHQIDLFNILSTNTCMNNDIDIERHTRKLNEEKLTKKRSIPA
jgi:hypothetical protein